MAKHQQKKSCLTDYRQPCWNPREMRLEICPYGDMNIILTTPSIEVTYLVSSIQLRSGSSYFRSMLGPHFAEGGKLRSTTTSNSRDSLLQVTAEDEFDPTALATVLYVLHAKPQHIPRTVTSENLLEIAIICNYYDCAAAMRPWDEYWVNSASSVYQQSGYEYWLFISWVFGKSQLFETLTKKFVRNGVIVDGEFGVMNGDKFVGMYFYVPESIIAAMADQRSKHGEEFTSACKKFYERYYDDTPIKCKSGVSHCDSLMFAAIHKAFVSKNLLDADAKLQVHLTLDSLLEDIKSVMDEITKKGVTNSYVGNYNHYNCNTFSEVFNSLQWKFDCIKPLRLQDFSKYFSGQTYRNKWQEIFTNAGGSTKPLCLPQALHFNICPDGDMDVVLKSSTANATYRVSSRQLCAGSSVFRDLISPEDVATVQKLAGGSLLQLPVKLVHDASALAAVLFVLHARVTELPENIPFESLVDIATVCNDYNCAVTLTPWNDKWIFQWNSHSRSGSCTLGYHDMIFVAWVFGQEQTFATLTKLFAQQGFPKDLGFVVSVTDDMKDAKKLHHSLSENIIASMTEQRAKAGKAIVKACIEVYEKFEKDVSVKCQTNPNTDNGRLCDHFVFAELHMEFKKARLLVKEFSDNIPPNVSISMLVRDLTKLFNQITTMVQASCFGTMNGTYHRRCRPLEHEVRVVKDVLENIDPLQLTSFGRSAARKPTWESILGDGGN
ncbi:hypothetical protein K440DRAFT_660452 [Wilcoxina mikolae CBS 423.85]|nr:hypothetical protein K440DRAFT_660452 [Wilcoxina mikolae CBS 423.85]